MCMQQTRLGFAHVYRHIQVMLVGESRATT